MDSFRNYGIFCQERIECQGRVEIAAQRGGGKTGALPGGVSSNLGCSLLAHVFLSVRRIGRGAHWSSCREESTDAESGIESGPFLKLASGEALTVISPFRLFNLELLQLLFFSAPSVLSSSVPSVLNLTTRRGISPFQLLLLCVLCVSFFIQR